MPRRLLTNFSKGELSPRLEGRPDLAAYFEGGRSVKNFYLLRQGGIQRRPGLRFIGELGRIIGGVVTQPADKVTLFPFEASVNDAFIVAMTDAAAYFYKNKARLDTTPGTPVQLSNIYGTLSDEVHFTQSVDVMYLFHQFFQQRRLSRFADTNWQLDPITYDPPPSFEEDTDVGTPAIASVTSDASSGTVTITASAAVFLAGDVGRIIVMGPQTGVSTGRVLITAFTSTTQVTGTVLDAVTAGVAYSPPNWKLRLSPQATLDPDKKAPAGSTVALVAGANAFRPADVGKFISVYGGLVKITTYTSATAVSGQLMVEMSGTSDVNPAAAPIGSWTLEIASWSDVNGFPGTGEFFGGRLGQARTGRQPTTFWLSAPDNYEDYGVGTVADRAVEYTIASRQLNRIEWMADNRDLFIGTSGSEHRAEGGREGEPIGGDVLPRVRRLTPEGSAPIQPVLVGRKVIFVDRSRTKVFVQIYDVESDEFETVELTGAADHIMGSGVRLGPIGVQRRLDPRVFFVTEDGELVTLTYSPREKVIGFSRIITDGAFEAVAVIPNPIGGTIKNPPVASGFPNDQVWVVVKRTIGGVDRRFLEVFEDHHEDLAGRKWESMQVDSGVVYNGVSTNTLTGLGHLEGKMVDVVADGSFRGQFLVTGGQVTIPDPFTQAEAGLHYDALVETMRPAIEGQIIEGLPRSWNNLWLRLRNTIGGHVRGEKIQYPPSPLGTLNLFTGDRKIGTKGWDTEGRILVEQREPYPMELLAVFGSLEIGNE